MKIYTTQREIEADIKDGVLAIEGDVKFECSFAIKASIVVKGDINALNIDALNINALNITALNINARNIDAYNITAHNIDALNIDVLDINAHNITAVNILYNAFCNVYFSINCESIEARRSPHSKPVCLDGKLTITPKASTKEMTLAEVIKELGYDVKIIE